MPALYVPNRDAFIGESTDSVQASDVEIQGASDNLVVGLKTVECFSFQRKTADHRRSKKRSILVYELEEFLPVDADQLAVGIARSAEGALVVAVDAERWKPLIQSLELEGRYIAAVSPVVFLAIGNLGRKYSLKQHDLVVWQSEEGVDLVAMYNGKPVEWVWCSDFSAFGSVLDSLCQRRSAGRVLLLGNNSDLETMFPPTSEILSSELARHESAVVESERIAAGRASPILDLREGPLRSPHPYRPISRSLWGAATSLLLVQVILIASLWGIRQQYLSKIEDRVSSQEAAFAEVFPGASKPVGITSRLESERRRLAGTRGISGNSAPKVQSALLTAHVFLSALPEPETARFAIDRLDFTPESVQNLSGTARSYRDLEYFAERLRPAGLQVPPVSATASKDGVSLQFDKISLKQADDNSQ